ncbi:MAG: hypothetical protein H7Y17_05725 [Chlorobia bacterium]|nr:hypothetical protein [Fimbriimonadaceae bacterium]
MKIQFIAIAVAVAGVAAIAQDRMVHSHFTKSPIVIREMGTDTMMIIDKWMPEPKKVAMKMIDKYGQPNEATKHRLIWWDNGPWKYSILENVEIPHDFPMPHKDMLRQVINYKVMPDKVDDLSSYDGSVIFDRTPGELSARCDKEEANFLAINLAHDVVTGKRSVKDARKFYAMTIKASMAMTATSEQKEYMMGLTFKQPMMMTNAPDTPYRE